jgi:flavin-dependent dehydrogenase
MADPLFDVAVIGAGPAGSACAASLCLMFPGLAVLLLERTRFDQPRIGEVLPAAALSLLRQVGFPLEKLDGMSTASHMVASAWGEARLLENHHLFSAAGQGFHLDRNRFDAALCLHAEASGAEVRMGTSLHAASRDGGHWHLELSDGAHASARFVVDATGRRCQFARSQGVMPHALDGLTAYSRFAREREGGEGSIIIEACQHGWWYTAPLPNGRRIVSFLSDVDLARGLGMPSLQTWGELLDATEYIVPHVRHAECEDTFVVRSASTAMLSAAGGEGWLATGDALASCDPLAAQGIAKAIHSGVLASYAAVDALHGKANSHSRYGALMARHMEGFLRMHAVHYAQEMRWPEMPFWSRRHRARMEEAA